MEGYASTVNLLEGLRFYPIVVLAIAKIQQLGGLRVVKKAGAKRA